MLITCRQNYKDSLIKGKDYLVIEIYTNIHTKKISYRITDEQGVLAIYDCNLFELSDPSLDRYAVKINDFNLQIMLNSLLEMDKLSSNSEGLWGDYFDGKSETIETVHKIIKEYAKFENIAIPEPIAY